MDKRGAKGYWISTATIIDQELFDEYVKKVGPFLKHREDRLLHIGYIQYTCRKFLLRVTLCY